MKKHAVPSDADLIAFRTACAAVAGPRLRWELRCPDCGRFVPRANAYPAYDGWYGVAFLIWECAHCGGSDASA